MMLSKCFLLCTILLASSFSFLSASQSQPTASLEPVTLQLRWMHQFQFAGYYAAVHKGFYRERGLEVTISAGSSIKTPVNEVLKGNAQYGEANSELLERFLKGEPLVALAAIFQHSPSVLLSLKKNNIATPHQLLGKRVMMVGGGTDDIDFRSMLANEGIKESDIHILASSYNIQDLVDGKTDVFNAYLTNEPFFLKQQGIQDQVINPMNYGIDFYSDILFTTQDELKNHPERVKAFREASLLGWEYAMSHKQEIIELILARYSQQKTRAHLEFEAEAMENLILPGLIPMGNINPGRFQRMAEIMQEFGLVETEIDLDDFIYDPNPTISLDVYVKTTLIISLLLIISAIVGVLLFRLNRRLSTEVARRRKLESNLQENYESYQAAINTPALGFLIVDMQGKILEANDAYVCMSLYNKEELSAMAIQDIEAKENSAETAIHINAIKNAGFSRFRSAHRRKDGTEWPVEIVSTYSAVHGGRLFVFIEDIGEKAIQESHLKLASLVIDTMDQAIVITDSSNKIISINPATARISGYSTEEVIGKNPRIFSSGRHDRAFYEALWASLKTNGHWEGEIWDRRKDGTVYVKWMSINAIANSFGDVSQYLSVSSDITDRKKTEELIWEQANHDSLTGLTNRSYYNNRLNEELNHCKRSGSSLALLFIDLDGFKGINDTLGHEVGDKLLVELADRLKSRVRNTDVVSRLGGDEFTLLITDSQHPEQIGSVAELVLKAFNDPVRIDGHEIRIGASIGIAIYPADGVTADSLTRHADTAMYQAKEGGRNTFKFFSPEMDDTSLTRLNLIHELHEALVTPPFQLYYQPKFRLPGRELIGMEALIRWPKGNRELRMPLDFIPAAEETGLIIPIGKWVLAEACRQTSDWNRRFTTELKVAVNFSSRQLLAPDIVNEILGTLEKEGLAAHSLEIEITESSLMLDTEQAIHTMKHLTEQGLSIALDNFGNGYSSFNCLKRFPISTLKIDRSFVRTLAQNSKDAAFVQAIISMGESLELEIVAEGVETEVQLDFLLQHQCGLAQGYLLGKPMPATEFEKKFLTL